MLLSNLSDTVYATRFKKIFNPPNPDDMIKYERNIPFEYTAGANGETVIILSELIGALRIIQIEKEIKPMFSDDYSFNANTGQINLLNGVSLGAGQTLFGLAAFLITS